MKKLLILLCIGSLIQAANLNAQDFHVTISGDDSGTGSESDPWESIQHAMDFATVGSTVHIHEGTYNERVYVNVSGTDGNYITFKAFDDNAGDVILDGTGWTDYALMEIYDVHHIKIEGIKMMNNVQTDAVGILIEGECDHITIEDCDISNVGFSSNPEAYVTNETNAQPLIVYGTEAEHPITDLKIIDNEIFDCVLGYSEALAINGNVDGFIVAENEVHDCTNIGIDVIGHEGTCWDESLDQARNGVIADNEVYNCLSPYATSAGIYVDGGKDLIIERNIVYNNQWGIEIGCENIGKTTDNVLVRNNFVYRNSTAGIHLGGYDYPSGSGKVTNTIVINNSFFGNDTENDWTGEMYLSYNEGLEVRNNIFYADNENGMMMSDENLDALSTGMNITGNAWYHPYGDGNVEWAYQDSYYEYISDFHYGTGFAIWQIFVNPEFLNTGDSPDLHLTDQTGSQILNYGDISDHYGEVDIDGEIRNFGGAPDIGADEHDSVVSISELPESNLEFYPNPCLGILTIPNYQAFSEIEILDQSGKSILKTFPNHEIDLKHLSTGVYFIKLVANEKTIYRKKLLKL